MLLTKTFLATTVAATAVAGAAVLTAGPAVADPAIAGTYNTVPATRVLDTQTGTGAPKAKVPANGTVTFNAVGTLKTQLVLAEALTLTALSPAGAGHLVAYPGGTTRPGTSSLNFNRGRTASNLAIVPYGASGAVTIYNGSAHPIDIVADLSGYWTGGSVADDTDGSYNPLPSTRLLDTRSGTPIGPLGTDTVTVAGRAGFPESNVGAAVVNITVTTPTSRGYITATALADDQQGSQRTADVSFSPGRVASDLVVVPVDPDTGTISLYNGSTAPVNVVIDVVGYFSGGAPADDGAFEATTPYRNSDTRTGAPVPARTTTRIPLGVGGSPSSVIKAVVATVSVVGADRVGYLTAWSGSGARPGTSSLNFTSGVATSVTVIVPVNADGSISIFNGSSASVGLIVDVHGFVLNDLGDESQAGLHSLLAHARSSAAKRTAS